MLEMGVQYGMSVNLCCISAVTQYSRMLFPQQKFSIGDIMISWGQAGLLLKIISGNKIKTNVKAQWSEKLRLYTQ